MDGEVSRSTYILSLNQTLFKQSLENSRLKGLVKFCPFLQMDGEVSRGTYILSLNQTLFKQSLDS